MSLYDDASLIQVPSLYKDGLLVSTVPEDRSGDFVFSRGSNLAATRVNSSGFIEKGYENLLLQSNTFSDAAWSTQQSSVTNSQSGYDGTNNAWLFNGITFNSRIQRSTSASGVQTFSIYAKSGTYNFFRVRLDFSGGYYEQYFNLSNGTLGSSAGSTPIDSSIEAIGSDGWYRCFFSLNSATTFVRIYPASGNTSINGAGSIYIQDAQINQGLVAYPYLETTTASVSGGILEDQPRLDYTNGTPALLIEPSRTNLVNYSEFFGYSSWNTENGNQIVTQSVIISPDGAKNGSKLETTSGSDGQRKFWLQQNVAIGSPHTFSIYIKQVSGEINTGFLHITTGANDTFDVSQAYTATNEWQRFSVTTASAKATVARFLITGASNSQVYIYGAQAELGSYPTSYIPTYGTSVTRAKDLCTNSFATASSATLYNSFYSTEVKTLYILDQLLTIAVGENKLAFAFTPTTITISLNGSIVADATGTYDTTALASIQLGNDNGEDYSESPISGFYVFPSVLTNTELNSLTV